ncbi:putative hydrolase or acyltransferase of alpha/beta superfamily [Belliella baltica DSM 15883]|uniref:Putative hydrolase or acyltransferase of alpha/beta superfamily n=1 Tax=Belliella baltica (strain DSM 15883 / CIP 108006 / LMG 21964 / BA134) TaxID=866536 RepID=I3Z8B5_BELBD|nr:alpha/beta hydrolase [Belliella baltica]AFL85483.1 putative hydrolase or acyltransferase of alpha/beta superfamily [Belliella baltica DSM 15883]
MKKVLVFILKLLLVLLIILGLSLSLSYRSDINPEILIEKYANESSYFINVDGINMHVNVRGEGEPIFLIHGSFSSLHTWEEWVNELSPYFMTISMDLPGHGLTGPDVQQRYGVEAYADLLFTLADHLGVDKFHIAGNSMGGAVALRMASVNSDRILTLNLINSSGAPNPAASKTKTKSSNSSKAPIFQLASHPIFSKILLKCTPKFLFKMNMNQVYYDSKKIEDGNLTRYYELMRREGNRRATLERLTNKRPLRIDFEKIDMPVLIIWGREDNWIPLANGERLAAAIPGSKFKVFDSVGHVPMEEMPTETVLEYLSFLGIQSDIDYFSPPKYYSHAFRKSDLSHFTSSNSSAYLFDLQVTPEESY